MEKVNVHDKLALIQDQWNPRIVGELNGQHVRLVKIQGNEFEMHCHPDEDEMFFVINGEITLELEDETINLKQNEFYIVRKGIMHKPVAKDEAELMMFVTSSNINTGNISNNFTLVTTNLEQL